MSLEDVVTAGLRRIALSSGQLLPGICEDMKFLAQMSNIHMF
jgi:hypothetical protein